MSEELNLILSTLARRKLMITIVTEALEVLVSELSVTVEPAPLPVAERFPKTLTVVRSYSDNRFKPHTF